MTGKLAWCGIMFGSAVLAIQCHEAAGQAPSCPRRALLHLQPLIGEWNAEWDVRVDDTLFRVGNAHATIVAAAAGCGLVERLDGTFRGAPKGLLTVIAAPSSDSLQLTYVDSDHGGLLNFTGTIEGDTARFAWSRNLGDRTQLVRREYSGISTSGFSTQTIMSPDGGAHWVLVQRGRYTRRP